MLYYFFKSVPTLESPSTTTFTFRHFRQFTSLRDWFAGGASATSVAPPPPRSLSLACAAYLYSWSTTFLVAAAASFSSVCRVRLDDVCGFSTKSRRGQWALLPPLYSSLATTAGCSTKWNSFAILGRAHVHTHLLAFSTSSSSRLWITRTEKSHSPESNWNWLPRGHTTTHTKGKITLLHTEN